MSKYSARRKRQREHKHIMAQWEKAEQVVIEKMINPRKNEYGITDLTPYNVGRKNPVYK